jgi:hypothetical protein
MLNRQLSIFSKMFALSILAFSVALTPEAFAGKKLEYFKTKVCRIKNKIFKHKYREENESNTSDFAEPDRGVNDLPNELSQLDKLPDELLLAILQNSSLSELAHAMQVSNRLNGVASEVIDTKLLERFQDFRRLDQNHSLSREDFLSLIKGLPEDVKKLDRIDSLSKSELRELLDRRLTLLSFLLEKIHKKDVLTFQRQTLEKKKKRNFDPNKTYLAAFLARDTINLGIAWSAAWITAQNVAWAASGNAVARATLDVVRNAASIQDGIIAGSAAEKVLNNADWNVATWVSARIARSFAGTSARAIDYSALENTINNATKRSTRRALVKLELIDPEETGKRAYHLSELVTLRWLEQNGSQYFEMAFNSAHEKLDHSITIEEAKEMINLHTGKEELSENPFIQELKAFLVETEKLVQVSEETPLSLPNLVDDYRN